MQDSWTISVGGRAYGPYTGEQMRSFAAVGRLAPHSLVAQSGSDRFQPASGDPTLATFFRAARPSADSALLFPAQEEPPQPRFGRKDESEAGLPTQYIIVADMKSRSIASLEEEIFSMGPAYAILPQVWILLSATSLSAIRNALVQKLGKLDMLFVLDAAHNKVAWFNFGPEADARIRRIWSKAADLLRPQKIAS